MKKYLEQLHILKLFHLKEIVSITGSERSGQELLLNYKKQGLVNQIRRDLYTVTDLATKANIATKFEIGSHITPSAYISYHSALEYHGVAHQVFYDLFISSEQRFNEFEFEDIHYNYCKSSFELGVYTPQMNSMVKVTDLERTVIDCLDRIDRAGGLEEIIHCFSLITYLDEKKLLSYLSKYDKAFLHKKVGFVLQYFKDNVKLSDDFISECKQKGGPHVKYLTNREESSTYFGEWKLCAPKNILSYLEQGENELI